MKIEGNKITASEGMILVNINNLSEPLGVIIHLGIGDNANNYTEVLKTIGQEVEDVLVFKE